MGVSWEGTLSLAKFKVSYLTWFYSYQRRVKRKQLLVTTSHRVWKVLDMASEALTQNQVNFCIHWPHEKNNSFIQRQSCCPRHFWHHLWPCWHVGTSSLPTWSPKALSLLNICECLTHTIPLRLRVHSSALFKELRCVRNHLHLLIISYLNCRLSQSTVSLAIYIFRNKLIQEESLRFSSRNGDFLENWTKWKLYLLQDSGESLLVQPDMQISISNLVKKDYNSLHFL